MAAFLALIFFVLPIAEIAVLMAVGDLIGFWPTLIILIGVSIAGAVLAKREGVEVWRRFRSTLSRGQIPSSEIIDGMMVLLGGALLLTPGFVTDVLGLVLLIPGSRKLVKRLAVKGSGWYIGKRFGLAGWAAKQPIVKVATSGSSRVPPKAPNGTTASSETTGDSSG